MKRIYFVVEGQHDVEVVGRLLKLHGLARVRLFQELDKFWERLVPRRFPHEGDLLARVPAPSFFASAEMSVAIQAAGSVNKVSSIANVTWTNLDELPEGLGVLVDADAANSEVRWNQRREGLPDMDFGSAPGKVGDGAVRAGIYVLPDNKKSGTLEHLLLACAEKAYPKLLAGARKWIEPIDPADSAIFANRDERREFAKPAGKAKAVASCIAGVLRPGKAIQVSIQDNLWLENQDALALPEVRSLRGFVDAILGMERPEPGGRLSSTESQ